MSQAIKLGQKVPDFELATYDPAEDKFRFQGREIVLDNADDLTDALAFRKGMAS